MQSSSFLCHSLVVGSHLTAAVTSPGMALFLKNVAFHGILLDALFEEGNKEWEEVSQLLKEGILGGVVQPLRTTVFQRDQVEQAFRFMAQGKHIGKVLLQVGVLSELQTLVVVVELMTTPASSLHRSVRRKKAQLYSLPLLCLCQPSVELAAPRPSPTSSLVDWEGLVWSWLIG